MADLGADAGNDDDTNDGSASSSASASPTKPAGSRKASEDGGPMNLVEPGTLVISDDWDHGDNSVESEEESTNDNGGDIDAEDVPTETAAPTATHPASNEHRDTPAAVKPVVFKPAFQDIRLAKKTVTFQAPSHETRFPSVWYRFDMALFPNYVKCKNNNNNNN